MGSYLFDNELRVRQDQADRFRQDGFVKNVVSDKFPHEQVEPAIIPTLKARERAGIKTGMGDHFKMPSKFLNSPIMPEILESHQIEEGFKPGKVPLFDKYVVHRDLTFGDGTSLSKGSYCIDHARRILRHQRIPETS